MVESSSLIGVAEAALVSRAFLASPAATRVAEGASTTSTVRVLSIFTDDSGEPCRIVEQTVMINAETVHARGAVCQHPDGQWAFMRK
jgi:surface antigen